MTTHEHKRGWKCSLSVSPEITHFLRHAYSCLTRTGKVIKRKRKGVLTCNIIITHDRNNITTKWHTIKMTIIFWVASSQVLDHTLSPLSSQFYRHPTYNGEKTMWDPHWIPMCGTMCGSQWSNMAPHSCTDIKWQRIDSHLGLSWFLSLCCSIRQNKSVAASFHFHESCEISTADFKITQGIKEY